VPHERLLPVGQGGPGILARRSLPVRHPFRCPLAWPDEQLGSICGPQHPRWLQEVVVAGHSSRPGGTMHGAGTRDAHRSPASARSRY
jgi:hypothetical protein